MLGQPLRGPRETCGGEGRGLVDPFQRPRKGLAVHLARAPGRQRIDDGDQRNERRREPLQELPPGGCDVDRRPHPNHHVPHEDLAAAGRRADRRGGTGDVRELLERRIDLPELDAAAPELDLIVAAADEHEPPGVVAHQVAAPVGPVPSERRDSGEPLPVAYDVQVARHPDATDDELPDLARTDRQPGVVQHREVPAVQGVPDPHRPDTRHQRGARDDRRLGGAIGVPDLATRDREPRGQLSRAGFPAEDQQTHPCELLRTPQARERRHGGNHSDLARDEPRSEVHAGPDERTRRRDEARAVRPRQPHLLAGRVERHGQPGEHAVAGSDRRVREKEPRLGIDECGSGSVADGDPLGRSRRARGEDDPRIVLGDRAGRAAGHAAREPSVLDPTVLHQHGNDVRLGEDGRGPLLRVVDVHRDVRGTSSEDRKDRHVQLVGARRDPDSDAVARPHPRPRQGLGAGLDGRHECRIGERRMTVVDRPCAGVTRGRRLEDVDQRPARSGVPAPHVPLVDRVHPRGRLIHGGCAARQAGHSPGPA